MPEHRMDKRALKLVNANFVKRLKPKKYEWTLKKGFVRWNVMAFHNRSFKCFQKVLLTSRISFDIAIYRFKFLAGNRLEKRQRSTMTMNNTLNRIFDDRTDGFRDLKLEHRIYRRVFKRFKKIQIYHKNAEKMATIVNSILNENNLLHGGFSSIKTTALKKSIAVKNLVKVQQFKARKAYQKLVSYFLANRK